jgi:hypothetical protein
MKNQVNKLELEKIYKEYCIDDLGGIEEEDKFKNMMLSFIEFRLEVSGGSEYNCMVSMNTPDNFLDEIFLFNDMMDDWSGQYRGDFSYEHYDYLKKLLATSDLEENIKNEILEGFRKRYEID